MLDILARESHARLMRKLDCMSERPYALEQMTQGFYAPESQSLRETVDNNNSGSTAVE
jgi:hypothetical protein